MISVAVDKLSVLLLSACRRFRDFHRCTVLVYSVSCVLLSDTGPSGRNSHYINIASLSFSRCSYPQRGTSAVE